MKQLAIIPALVLASSAYAYAQTPHELDLAWDYPAESATPIAGFRVYFSDDAVPQPNSASVDVGPATTITFPHADLPQPADDDYYLAVESYSAADQRSTQTPIRIIVEFGPPAAPENVRVMEIREIEDAIEPPESEPQVQTIRVQPRRQ